MMRRLIVTILAVLVGTFPAAAQDQTDAVEAVKAIAKAQADAVKEARKVAKEVQRVERVERAQRADRQREDQRAQQTETITRTVKLGAEGEIDLQNMSGNVTVTRGSGSEATIAAVKTARAATDAEAKEVLGMAKVDIAERAGRVEVRTHYMHFTPAAPPPPPASGDRSVPRPPRAPRRNVNVSVAYNITAPTGSRLKINTMSGDISVADITGELQLEAMSGDITVERGARVLTARAMSGDVTLVDVKSDGALDAGSMSGDVALRQVRARRINASVVSGTVSLTDVECERLEGQTTSGEVVYEGQLSKGGRYHFQSHSGDVKVLVGGNIGFELDANSWGGSVRSELELKNVEQLPDNRRSRVGPRNRMLRGTFGDGSAVLDITTFSGSIVVGKRSQ
jgi:DUF4097 and DUF4098 domain-containing protein YvlB